MILRFAKKKDETPVLSCHRADGSVAWQKQSGSAGAFFPTHDLMHYAVEVVLGISDAFYGLLARGWEFNDFGSPWRRGRLGPNANAVEVIIGTLQRRASEGDSTVDAPAFNAEIADTLAKMGASGFRALSESELIRIDRMRSDLFERWRALRPDEGLELAFDL